MAKKKKVSYKIDGNVILRSGVAIAEVIGGELKMYEGCKNYRLSCSSMVAKIKAASEEPEVVEEIKEVVKEAPKKNALEIKNETIEDEPVNPILAAKRARHNPFGLPPGDVPPCPKGDDRGTKDPIVMEWLKKHFPEEYEIKYEDYFQRIAFREAKEERKKQLRGE